jgi:hypothetical protein
MNKITLTMPQTAVPTEESMKEENRALKEKLLRLKRVGGSITEELQTGLAEFGRSAARTGGAGGGEEVAVY